MGTVVVGSSAYVGACFIAAGLFACLIAIGINEYTSLDCVVVNDVHDVANRNVFSSCFGFATFRPQLLNGTSVWNLAHDIVRDTDEREPSPV